MKPEAQIIAIAQACGKRIDRPATGWHDLGCDCRECYPLPDYLNDLNAMHEAEKVLLSMDGSCGYWETYSNALTAKLGCVDIFHATAEQRAEVFLKTLNRWTDDT